MKFTQALAAAVLGLASAVHGHMEMKDPPPFKSKYNPNAGQDIDYSMTSPLEASGSDFPCKGYQSLLGTPEGKSVATWAPGGSYGFTITGSANHGGGSCQASLSYDQGKTWKVIHSYIGGCPPQQDSNWNFTVPTDAPAGEAMFAWTWFNQIGNREMYMNCAAVTISGSKKRAASAPLADRASTPLADLPDIFVANVGNGVCTYEGKDVLFPNPGPDVDNKSQGTAPPGQGTCSGAPPAGVSQPQATQPAASAAPTAPGGVFITHPAPTSAPAPAAPTTAPQPTTSSPPANGSAPTSSAAGSPCTDEGQWSCASDGKSFQRCASGVWSAAIPVAQGTSCQPGTSDSLTMVNKRSFVRRGRFVPKRFRGEDATA
ncbi:lytic polysaccharide monooxygenase [Trichoderma citrinoviride]|uniref:Lytic polysaccharide monooxygenase n=1 Tax=Trichoderma citrinoviride TaxID=58853 RepID=A0A2T4B500_9HYPO|nr:lytic polysaccharide monooxygenase [Trichoderma citrinoviride]PTB64405.1 lytic polysaccharide monooxygenase [Trichoderma citrinoviride]